MKNIILILLAFSLFSCSKEESKEVAERTGVELISLGTSNFGGILVGGSKSAAIEIKNYGPNTVDLKLDEKIIDPFSIVSRSSNCFNNFLEKDKSCIVTVRFSPQAEGEFKLDYEVLNQKISFQGIGLVSGVLVLDQTDWNIGESVAGIAVSKNFKLKNLGDLTVRTPLFNLPSYISLGFNQCGSFIAAKAECSFSLEARMLEAREYNDVLRFISEDGGFVEINILSSIIPSAPSGLIQFVEVPSSMSSGGEEFLIRTLPIKDSFNNTVTDGTSVSVSVNANLLILTGNQYLTENGIIELRVRTRTVKGSGAISVTSNQANGYISFPITAGEPFGDITVASGITTLPANELTQVIITTNTLFDQYLNIVEDGTPVYFQMIGDATISSGSNPKEFSNVTINGRASVVVQAGRVAEIGKLKIFAGPIYNELNEIVGYRANGEVDLTFEPGPAAGNIPITSSLSAIYADNNPPPDITIPTQTFVTVGPVKDQFGNIVKPNSEISVNIQNGFNVSGTIPESVFKLYTDSDGYAFFNLIGNNQRGYITINTTSSLGQGIHQVWGYKRRILSFASSNDNAKVLFKHHNSGILPSPLVPWGIAEVADNSGDLDGVYYGYRKLSDIPKTEFKLNDKFPFLSWDCFFSAGDELVGNFCMQPDETYSPLIRYTRNNNIRFDAPDLNPSPELVGNGDFSIQDKLSFWGGITESDTGAKWSNSHGGMMWIDNRTPVNFEEGEQLNRGISDWITINPTKKYLLKFLIRDQIGDNENRYGVVGIIEGDEGVINDPAYEIPPPIILKDDYFGTDINGIIQRIIYTPSGDSNVIKLYFSTRGAGNRSEIKYDNISFQELNTQNIHDNFSTEGVSVAYMKELDSALMFGGNGLEVFSYPCEDGTCNEYSALSSNRTTILNKIEDQSVGVLITSYDENNNFDLGSSPPAMGHMQLVGLDREVYGFGGFTSGGYGSAFDGLMHFDGVSLKWNQISPLGDGNLPEDENLPSARYQHGLLHIPELNSLYVMGGLSQNEEVESVWQTNDDFWKLDLSESVLQWNRICNNCNLFPEGVYPSIGNIQDSLEKFPNFTGRFQQYQDAIHNMKRTNTFWHAATQTAYIYLPESDIMKEFNPYTNMLKNVDQESGPYLLRDSFQMAYNSKTGRLYGYKQGSPLLENSQIWQWDMDRDQKQYLRFQFNLAETAKQFVQELKVLIYGYGNSTTYRIDKDYISNGLEAYLYDHDSNNWVSIGFNSAKNQIEAQTPIEFTLNIPLSAKRFISEEGKLDVLITPQGRPGYDGGETLMGDDLSNVNVGLDSFNMIEEVRDISVGLNSSCALLMNGELKCWGRNDFGQLGLGLSVPAIGVSSNSMGGSLQETSLFNKENPDNFGLSIEKIFSGNFHNCALFNNKRIKCWGLNDYGQLGFQSSNSIVGDGFGEMGDNLPFVDLGTKDGNPFGEFSEVESLVIGDSHTCAYLIVNEEKDIHRVKCWGRNNYGQLGYGDLLDRGLNPATMGNNLPYISQGNVFDSELGTNRIAEIFDLAAGKNHTCISVENSDSQSIKKLMCWGHNAFGQLGIETPSGDVDYSNKLSPTITDIRTYDIFNLSAGGDHSCMYYNNNLRNETYCWGRNDFGQLGRGGDDEPVMVDLPVNLEFEFRDVNYTEPIPVIADQSQGILPDARALFRKMTRFRNDLNSRIQFDHLITHDIADNDFAFEFEIRPNLIGLEMPIISKLALSSGVYDNSQITQTGGWVVRINTDGKLEFHSEGFGVVAQSIRLDEGYQVIRVIKEMDINSGYHKIKFYRNNSNEWQEITDLSLDINLNGLNLSNSTDAPLVIGSIFDESPVVGPQRTKFFDGFIGYIFLEIGNSAIDFQPSSIPSNDLLAPFVDLGQGFSVKDISVGRDHSCVLFDNDRIKCFGNNNSGQTGYDYRNDKVGSNLNDMGENLNFVDLGSTNQGYLPVKKVVTGGSHNCVLLDDENSVKCWGNNSFGQLGQEDTRSRGRGFPLERGTNELFIDFVGLEGIF